MRVTRRFAPVHLLPFSFVGLILVATLTGLPPAIQDDDSWRKPLAGSAFGVLLILGILAGIFPSTCSGRLHFRTLGQREPVQKSVKPSFRAPDFRGHHPDCGHFSAHVLQAGRVFFCAGCTGLVLGAALSLTGVAWYFFLNSTLGPYHVLVFWIGFAGVACGLLQYHLFDWGGSFIHLALNVFFVVGVSMLLAGADAATRSAAIDMYVVVLSVFWLYVRILLSRSHHRRICTACGKGQCGYS